MKLARRLAAALAFGVLIGVPAPAIAEEDECAIGGQPDRVRERAAGRLRRSDWQVEGVGDPTIQGYATVDERQRRRDRVTSRSRRPSTTYHIDILRLGYYGGDGAGMVASNIQPTRDTAADPAGMPDALLSTGLIDCGNWGVSASWTVPSTAVSGVYIAHLVATTTTGGDSQIPFVVRNDASHSEILLQTSDATWEAYNDYGGNSLYTCTVDCPPGEPEGYKAAYAVSYNRPFDGSFDDRRRRLLPLLRRIPDDVLAGERTATTSATRASRQSTATARC